VQTPRDTRTRAVFSGKAQIRKVQRRGCKGGGNGSLPRAKEDLLSNGCVEMIVPETGAGPVTTEKLPAQVRASGDGAFEMAQQPLPAFETVTAGFSPCSIPMFSQSVMVG